MCVRDDGTNYVTECECMGRRRSERIIRKSGLADLMERYTISSWQTPEAWQARIKNAALDFVENPVGWFYVGGNPGTGKTHICTAICSMLMKRGMETRYLLWRDFAVRAKGAANDGATYDALLAPYRNVRVLYVDDLFKTGRGSTPTTGDVNLAFELLNDRYNNERLITIISSELTVDRLLEIDEGLGSRIYERSASNYFDLSGGKNWRIGADAD